MVAGRDDRPSDERDAVCHRDVDSEEGMAPTTTTSRPRSASNRLVVLDGRDGGADSHGRSVRTAGAPVAGLSR
jgi:hypothetical protein